MIGPILFLDIDGVLNAHEFNEAALSCSLRKDCVERLNLVIETTGCVVVLSSSWRYMILGGSMTLTGFSYMLRTHGVTAKIRVVDTTCEDDEDGERGERGRQIHAWLEKHPSVRRYAVIDDMPTDTDDFSGLPIVRVDGGAGITDAQADLLISELRVDRKAT